MTTSVYFVRHAEPNFNNHNDLMRELSDKGMEGRKLVTDFFKDKHIDLAVSSPFKRAVDTIEDFTSLAGLRIELIDDFRERKITDEWIEDFKSFSKKQWSDFDYKLTGGESLREVQDRNVRALHKLLHEHKGKNIIVGSHGTALSTIIHYYDPYFSHEDFERIKGKMPWIALFVFDDEMHCGKIAMHDLY